MRHTIRDKLLAAFCIVIVGLTLPIAFFFVNGYWTANDYRALTRTMFIEADIRQQCDEIAALIPTLIAKDSQDALRQLQEKQSRVRALLVSLQQETAARPEQRSYQQFNAAVNSYLTSCDLLIAARQADDLKELTAQLEQALFKSSLLNRDASRLIADEIALLSVTQEQLIAHYWQSLAGEAALILLLLCSSVAFVLTFSSRIRHDLSQILQAFEQLARGSTHEIHLTPRSHDEIGDLALKFNWLAARLNAVLRERDDSNAMLQQSYEQLEHRVAERTQELNAVNQELLATNEQLNEALSSLHLTQTSLVQAEKLAALGSLVSGVAHELNTPVGNCITLASHLEDSTAKFRQSYAQATVTRSQLANYLQDNCDSCRSLMLNLATTARLIKTFKQIYIDKQAEERAHFSICDQLADVAELVKPQLRQAGVALKLDCASVITLDSYPEALSNVLLSLIQNSLLHAFSTGQSGLITIRAVGETDGVHLEYRDNGKGLTGVQLQRIFEPFFTTKRGRGCVGLGLHTVFNIVTRLLGGSIRCDSQPGHGVVFDLVLPYCAAPAIDRQGGDES